MNPVFVLFALSTLVLAALWLEARVVAIKKLGAAATAILSALVLSNVGLLLLFLASNGAKSVIANIVAVGPRWGRPSSTSPPELWPSTASSSSVSGGC